MDTRRGPFPKLRRHFRRGCDEGSASMASYIVAASVFILGSSYLLHFVIEPPGGSTSTIEHQNLRVSAQTALEVLLGTPGYPASWDGDVTAIQRLGLIERGTTIRIDPNKFDALARGKLATASADGYIDYAEAKDALGIDGYEFHLRAYPVTAEDATIAYGIEGMEDYRIAYVGDFESGTEQGSSKEERGAIDALAISFTNTTRSAGPTGDVYTDSSSDIRTNLLPVIGPTIQETVIGAGAGTKYDFYRVNASTYDPLVDKNSDILFDPDAPDLTSAMALSSDGATLGYTKNRELRAIIGGFNVSSNAGSIDWREYVDTGFNNNTFDCGDYGFVEVSFDDGSSWTRLTDTAALRSQDCDTVASYKHGTEMEPQSASFTCTCTRALLGFHWIGDNDNNGGYGWIVDDVVVTSGGQTRLSETFSAPEYDMIIIGSNVDHGAFTPDDVKNGIRDYVDLYGGRLVVVGGQNNVQWMDRLFDAATGGSSGGVATPDTTHPLITLPNQLAFTSYTSTDDWEFTEEESTLFSMIMGESATEQELSVSRPGAWSEGGSADGAVILTSYKPYEWETEETRKFFANAAIYGKFHYLYLEVGPEVPDGEAVASISRSATMNKYRTGEANYTEMAFVMYLWPGSSAADTLAGAAITPTAPRSLSVTSTTVRAELTWRDPASEGTTNYTHFEVWRGHSETTITGPPVKIIPRNTSSWPYSGSNYFNDTNISDGTTYYYNVTAAYYNASTGLFERRGTPSAVNSTTPFMLPSAPGGFAATPLEGMVGLSWANPGTSSTGTILGYRLLASSDGGSTYAAVAEIGNVTSYNYAPGDTSGRHYKIQALNARDYGTASTAIGPVAALEPSPIAGPVLTVVGNIVSDTINLTWVAPDPDGQTITGWKIWRGDAELGTYSLLATLTDPLNVSFGDASVGSEATYWYKVQATTNVIDGTNSSAHSATSIGLSSAPTAFGATQNALVGGRIDLSWGPPSSFNGGILDGYRLWRSPDGATWSELANEDDLGAASVSYSDTGLGANTSMYYRLQAVTEVGGGAYTSSATATTLPPAGVPLLFVASNSTNNTLALSWQAPVNLNGGTLTGYKLWRSSDGFTWTNFVNLSDANTSFSDVGVGVNTTRYYKIQADTTVGWGSNTTAISPKTAGVPYPPSFVDATYVLGTTTVTWVDGYSALSPTAYEVCKSSSNGGACTTTYTPTGSPSIWIENNLNKWFAVRTYSPAGWSGWSYFDRAG